MRNKLAVKATAITILKIILIILIIGLFFSFLESISIQQNINQIHADADGKFVKGPSTLKLFSELLTLPISYIKLCWYIMTSPTSPSILVGLFMFFIPVMIIATLVFDIYKKHRKI